MRKFRTILVASVVAASLYAAAGTAWAHSASGLRGTAWTGAGPALTGDPGGASWELFRVGFAF